MPTDPTYEITVTHPNGDVETAYAYGGWLSTHDVTRTFPGCSFNIRFLGRVTQP